MDTDKHNPPLNGSAGPNSPRFRSFLLTLVQFAMFAFAIYIVLVCALGLASRRTAKKSNTTRGLVVQGIAKNLRFPIGETGNMLGEARQTRNVDILVLGSSHANRGFDPRIFAEAGFKMFNMGSGQQSHMQTRLLLQRYLDRLNPKVVLYEVYPTLLYVDGVESAIDIIANDRNDFATIQMALKMNHPNVYHAMIYGFFRDLFRLNKGVSDSGERKSDTYVPGGYWEKRFRRFSDTQRNRSPIRWGTRKSQLRAFEDNLAMIRKRNIRLVLIQAPWTKGRYLHYLDRAEYDDRMKTYGEYHNFNELIELDDHLHFYDWHHMNQEGVQRFNVELIRRIFPAGASAGMTAAGGSAVPPDLRGSAAAANPHAGIDSRRQKQ